MIGRKALVIAWCVLLPAAAPLLAQSPLANTSFEAGLDGWSSHTFSTPPLGDPGDVWVAGIGSGGFDVLVPSPPTAPDGDMVCGAQSSSATRNGGVYQQFAWNGGPASIFVTARAYSVDYSESGGQPLNNGCRVRMGLANLATDDRSQVGDWVVFPWADAWSTLRVVVPGPGDYTLFIEAVQPDATAIMSNLWDNVTFVPWPVINVTSGPTVTIPEDPQFPDSTARIEWTTDLPSTTRVDYGPDASYGQFSEDTELSTSHVVRLNGLTHSSTYHYRCVSTAPEHASYTSGDQTFDMPIFFREITTKLAPNGLSTIVAWKTDVPATSQVEYGETASYGSLSPEDAALVTDHEITLPVLEEEANPYHFRVWGRNPNSYQDAKSEDQTFVAYPAPGANLRNGGFEGGHGGQAHCLYPWVQYTSLADGYYHPIDGLIGPYPKGGPESWPADPPQPPYPPDIQAYEGSYFLGAASNSYYKNGGVFQRVYLPPNTYCTLSARFATYRHVGTYLNTRFRLGIDPNGGIQAESPDVKWWSTYSPTNDGQWHGAGITVKSGPTGIVTAFLDIRQELPLQWHVVAVDDASLSVTPTVSIGQLKAAANCLGAVFPDKIVTHVFVEGLEYDRKPYRLIYIEEADRSAGMAVMLDGNRSDIPEVGNKISVAGSLNVLEHEATLVAADWTVDPGIYSLPAPIGIPSKWLGGITVNQKGLFSQVGACNVGLRVRVYGRVTWTDSLGLPGFEANAYVDDGSGMLDGNQGQHKGVRVWFAADPSRGVSEGDYVSANGVLTIRYIDPNNYPGTGDEFYAYVVYTSAPEDWQIFPTSP